MQNVRTLILVLMSLVVAGRADEFEQANRLYDEGKFGEAKPLYEQLVVEGRWSANLFYNLGNVDFRLGAPGVAALNYERALALAPGHPEAAMNLKLLRDQTGARIRPAQWRDRVFPRSASHWYAIGGAIATWLACFILAEALTSRRRLSLVAMFAFLLAALVGAYGAAGAWHWSAEASAAIVTARQTEARLAPADRATRGEVLPAGSRVRVLSERGEWIYCALPGGGLGWLPASAIEKVRLTRA